MSYCKIIIQGNVGNDPDVRFTANGDAIANFSVAVSEKRGQTESTTWFRCTAFKKTAEVVSQYVKKGMPVLVDGRMASRKFTDKTGAERESWEIAVDRLQMLGHSKTQTEQEKPATANPEPIKHGFDDIDSDIPF
jgi:single-strand DNA-binding protein